MTIDTLPTELINTMITAIFPSLEILNGSSITALERENSEIYYLARIVEGNDLKAHPLYSSLVKSSTPSASPLPPPPRFPNPTSVILSFAFPVCGLRVSVYDRIRPPTSTPQINHPRNPHRYPSPLPLPPHPSPYHPPRLPPLQSKTHTLTMHVRSNNHPRLQKNNQTSPPQHPHFRPQSTYIAHPWDKCSTTTDPG